MPVKAGAEYNTVVVDAAYLVKGILQRLGFVSIVDLHASDCAAVTLCAMEKDAGKG